MPLLKMCSNCGGTHDFNDGQCQRGRGKTRTDAARFRSHWKWRKMSERVRERDKHLCQICLLDEYGTFMQYNSKSLEVNHILPAENYESLRLEPTNLITLCTTHHKLADAGKIPTWVQQQLATLPRDYGAIKAAIRAAEGPPTPQGRSG